MQEAREDPGRRDREASETFSRSRYTAFSRRRRRKEAFTEGPDEVATEFRDVGTPACTRQTERLLCVDGHRAAAVQEKKEMGHRRSYREQQPRWWC